MKQVFGLLLCAVVFQMPVFAADVEDLEVTIDLIDSNETGSAMMNRIELPFAASEQARSHAQRGLDNANQARHGGLGEEMRESRGQMRDSILQKHDQDEGSLHNNNGSHDTHPTHPNPPR